MHTCLPYLLKHTMVMDECLEVDIHVISAKGGDLSYEFLRLHNHQMHIKRLLAQARHMLHHGEAERNVRNKDPIHHIKVKEVGPTFIEPLHLMLQIAKIGSKQRRSY